MGQSLKYTEPTIWALRKNAVKDDVAEQQPGTLYEHLFGYDPIRVQAPANKLEGKIRRGSAENPALNIINPQTNFLVMEMASENSEEA